MNDRDFLYIKTVTETGSILKASQVLYMSQPRLSQALQRIEDELDTTLFIRTNKGIKLTPAGEKVYTVACSTLRNIQELKQDLASMDNLQTGSISFGVTNHLGSLFLPVVIPQYTKKYPGITVNVAEMSSSVLEKMMLIGKIDFALMHSLEIPSESKLTYEILRQNRYVPVASRNNPIAKRAVKKEGYHNKKEMSVIEHLFRRFIRVRTHRYTADSMYPWLRSDHRVCLFR